MPTYPQQCLAFTTKIFCAFFFSPCVIFIRRPRLKYLNTNPRRHFVMAAEFRTVTPNICGPSGRNLLLVTLPESTILKWPLDCFWWICAPWPRNPPPSQKNISEGETSSQRTRNCVHWSIRKALSPSQIHYNTENCVLADCKKTFFTCTTSRCHETSVHEISLTALPGDDSDGPHKRPTELYAYYLLISYKSDNKFGLYGFRP